MFDKYNEKIEEESKKYDAESRAKYFEHWMKYEKYDGQIAKYSDRQLKKKFRSISRTLAVQDRIIPGKVYIHHINPITDDEIMRESYSLIDPENLVCVSHITHEAIHYGNSDLLIPDDVERFPNDTCPWKG